MKLTFPAGEHEPVIVRPGELSIGRAPGNDVVVDNPTVAQRHAVIECDGDRLALSRAGEARVTVNGGPAEGRCAIKPGDEAMLGDVIVRIVDAADERATEPAADGASAAGEATTGQQTRVRPAVQGAFLLRGVSGEVFGRRFPLGRSTLIGRGDDCDIPLHSDAISRHHARVVVSASVLTVEDLGSSNGTFVNDQRVRRSALGPGDELRVDRVRFLVQSSDPRGEVLDRDSQRRAGGPSRVGVAAIWAAVALAVVAAALWLGGVV